MGKRQCEVELDEGGSLDEITNSQGVKRRRTSPKDEVVKVAVGGVQKEDKDPHHLKAVTTEKEGNESLSARATHAKRDPIIHWDAVATCEEGGVAGKNRASQRKSQSKTAEVPATPPAEDVQAPAAKSSTAIEKGVSTKASIGASETSSKILATAKKTGPASKAPPVPATTQRPSRGVKDRPKFQGVTLGDLCRNILNLPDDVAWEILGWLPPLYLLTLRNACKRLEALLEDPSPWKDSRKGMYDAPPPPEGVEEWDWAMVLWENKCNLCGNRSDLLHEGVDFYVARRHCRDCKWMDKDRVIAFPNKEIDKHYPDQPKELFDYVFHTPLQVLLPLKNSDLKQYWHADVRPTIGEWEEHQDAVAAGKENAAIEFEEWKEKRKREIALRFEMAPTYEEWKEGVAKVDQDTRVQHLKSRLRDLGFKQVDIDAAITTHSLTEIRSPPILHIKVSPAVTNAEWKKFRPALEPLVEAEQGPRVRPHLSGVLRKRYLEHVLTRPPSEFGVYPPLEAFAGSVALSYLLPDDPMLKPTSSSQDLSPFLKELPKLVDRYWNTKKDWLKQTLLSLSPRSKGYSRAHELAKHVFACADSPSSATGRRKDLTVCFGWRSAVRHACLGEWDELAVGTRAPGLSQNYAGHKPKRDNVLSSHAYELIAMVGEDPEKATVARMDELDPYYICDVREAGNEVYSWRGAILHVLEDRNATFSPAPEDATAKARAAAATNRERASVWSCNRCFSDEGSLKTDTKAGIMKHLRTGHKISGPKAGKDYFFNQDLFHLCEVGYEEPSGTAEKGVNTPLE